MPVAYTISPNPAGPGQRIVCRPTAGSFGVQLPDGRAVLRVPGQPDVPLEIAGWTTDITLVLPSPLPAGSGGVVVIHHQEGTGMVESSAALAFATATGTAVAFTMSPATVAPGQLTALDTVLVPSPGFGEGGTVTLTAGARSQVLAPEGAATDDRITVRVPADWPEGAAEVRFSRADVPDSTAALGVLGAALPVPFLAVPPVTFAGQQVTLDTVVDDTPGFGQAGGSFRLESGARSAVLQPEALTDDTAVVRIPDDWPLGASVVRFSRPNAPDTVAPLALRAPVLNLVLHELRCNKTEDWTKADDVIFELQTALGTRLDVHKGFKLDNGQTKRFERTYPAIASGIPGLESMPLVKFRLADDDWPDSDDHLGEVVVSAKAVDRAEGVFNLDDADYRVVYSVTAT